MTTVLLFSISKVVESQEMMHESKDPDTIDGAVRVAQLVNRSSSKKTLCFPTHYRRLTAVKFQA